MQTRRRKGQEKETVFEPVLQTIKTDESEEEIGYKGSSVKNCRGERASRRSYLQKVLYTIKKPVFILERGKGEEFSGNGI